ncbi:MAG: UbiH/UbiF/VisC/COQ6 family ubiquinone biosynthesis hydroxylase [Neomegalonema sp.]|nr:UbiH/UbiF/VisC/COQ6 family ubiquinone biosynthesis hydroxylase [Neomegalonema sp.]
MAENTAQAQAQTVIIGGGLVGSALALALAAEGIASVVLDPLPLKVSRARDFDGRAYAIALASRRMLSALGVWEAIAPDAQEILDILVSDGEPGRKASPHFVHFDSRELAQGFGHMVEDPVLRIALLDKVAASPLIDYRDGTKASSVARDGFGATITLDDGSQIRTPLAIACDGRRSAIAKAAGIERIAAEYDQIGLVCAVRHERPHHGVAHEYFLPAGPFAILPLSGGHRSSLVWTERGDMAEALRSVSDAVYLAELRRRFGDFLGALELDGKRWVYPLNTTVARAFVQERLALVGDAARGMHPIAGQGFNYGLRDAAALAEVLGNAQRYGEDLGDGGVLERYAEWRRPDSLGISLATDGLNRLFSNDMAPVRMLRRLGLSAFGQIAPLRRAAMSYAAGDRTDLPAIMRG